jgi:3-methyladenine DNA glycosylase/8-oxoguanine DNA glycosylase
MPTTRATLRANGPYDLGVALRGHGWVDLAPHRLEATGLRTVFEVDGAGVDVSVSAAEGGSVRIAAVRAGAWTRTQKEDLRRALRRSLRLDVDLSSFWDVCARSPELAWVPRKRAGHLMQSGTLFEDLLKILFTTNCSWSLTRTMARRLVDALGAPAPSGGRGFPSAVTCADQPESFWREEVRAGYRARHCVALSAAFAASDAVVSGLEDPDLTTPELRTRLLALPGFGSYAVGHALRGLGRYDDLALDSWCRAKMREILGRREAPKDAWFERRYRPFGAFAGLALWMELTADWHQDGDVFLSAE